MLKNSEEVNSKSGIKQIYLPILLLYGIFKKTYSSQIYKIKPPPDRDPPGKRHPGQRPLLDRDSPRRNMGPETDTPGRNMGPETETPWKEYGTRQPDMKWPSPLWTEWLTHTCENITLPLAGGKKNQVETRSAYPWKEHGTKDRDPLRRNINFHYMYFVHLKTMR